MIGAGAAVTSSGGSTSPDSAAETIPNITNDPTALKRIFHPVVFQCRQCRTIVADSSDLVTADARHRHVVFRREDHPNILVQPEWHLEQDGFAFGSVYQKLQCRNCGRDVGVRYHTTNADLDHLRGMLTLKTESLFVYELQFDDEQVQRDLAEMGLTANGDSLGSVKITENSKGQHYELPRQSEVEVVKLQKFCLVLYDRLVKLEAQVLALQPAIE